ncbi:hypothetical protein B0H11DRAFT_1020284 [Mycena galericulata]|nr:hypothetical protein B0H11DRAFT_1020284 [Mycena galericulata]
MSDDATLFANDQVREELRASIYYLSAIAATVQKSSNYDDESDAPLGDIPLKTRTKTGRLLNDLSTSLSRGGTDATRVIAVTSAPFFNRNRDLAVSVFSRPTLSPSNSSSAHKAEESGVEEEASSAEPRDVIITRNGGHKKLGARSQSLIPVPTPGQPLDFCVPKEFTQFAKHSLELLRAAACKMRSESPEEAAKTRLEVCVYFTDACQQKLAQRMHLLTDAYPIHKLQAWSYKSGVDPLDELPVSVDNSVVGFVLQTVGLIGRGDIYPYNKLTAGLWWKAVVFSLHQLDRAQKIANFRMTVKFSEALHDLLQIIPGEFWDSDPLVLFLRRCRFIPPPPIASLVEATSQEDKRAEDSRAEGGRLGDPTDSDAEGDQQHSNTERKREHGEEEDKQQDGDTDSDQPDDSTELKEKLGDEDERPDGDTDGEEYENIGNILPTGEASINDACRLL